MHLQATVELRALRPGAVHRPRDDGDELPARRADARPVRRRSTASSRQSAGSEAVAISQIVNAFFRWEFNSCEMLVAGRRRSTRSTTPTPAPTSRSPRCTTTSRGRSRPWCGGRVYCVVTGRASRGRPADRALLRDRRRRVAVVRREARPPTWRWPTSTSRPSATGSGRRSTSPTSTRRCSSGSPATTSTGCCARPSPRRTRRTSRRSFLAHFRGPARDVGARADRGLSRPVAPSYAARQPRRAAPPARPPRR